MTAIAAVGVHDYLAPGKSAVAHRAAHYKAAGGVNVYLGLLVHQLGGDNRLYHVLYHVLLQLIQLHVRVVLGGNHYGLDALDSAVLSVLHGHLGLAVGAQIFKGAVFTHLGKLPCQLMGKGDGGGHELRGLVTGIAEHHALVPRADKAVLVGLAILGLLGLVDAHGNIR